MHPFAEVRFVISAAKPADLPPPGLPELVFAGRSNVGKSSAINALCGRRRLAFTSKTPGRTQTINFFEADDQARLVDLPGYGYARVPKPLRQQWAPLIACYLESDRPIAGVVLVLDSRRIATELDLQLLGWLAGRRVLGLLSKADKLSRAEQAQALAQAKTLLSGAGHQAMLFSSLNGAGVAELRELLESWLQLQPAEIKSPR